MKDLVREFWDFFRHEKTQWIMPILVVLLILILVIVLTQTNVAPFIYSYF